METEIVLAAERAGVGEGGRGGGQPAPLPLSRRRRGALPGDGAADNARASIGFGRGKVEGEDEKAIQRLFAPEFRNRLDAVVSFKSLNPETIRQVVTKFVLQLEAQLADRNITIELTDDAADWLAKNGFDELYGARPLARVIQENIKKPLADDILFGRLTRGGHVKVELKDGKIAFDIKPASGGPVKETIEGEAV